jgi:hypothetical protein
MFASLKQFMFKRATNMPGKKLLKVWRSSLKVGGC